MKIVELKKVQPDKIGRVDLHGCNPEPHERKTFDFLRLFGFNIELLIPSSIPHSNNPDIFISGVIWEVKAPTSYNEQTLKNRFKKAAKQSDRIIVDLRNATKYEDTKKTVLKLFEHNHDIRRMMLITKEEKLLDFFKK